MVPAVAGVFSNGIVRALQCLLELRVGKIIYISHVEFNCFLEHSHARIPTRFYLRSSSLAIAKGFPLGSNNRVDRIIISAMLHFPIPVCAPQNSVSGLGAARHCAKKPPLNTRARQDTGATVAQRAFRPLQCLVAAANTRSLTLA